MVAVAQLASEYAHGLADGHGIIGSAVPFLFVFFAIWWAWMNFTWFSSAYDTDDVLYRVLHLRADGRRSRARRGGAERIRRR